MHRTAIEKLLLVGFLCISLIVAFTPSAFAKSPPSMSLSPGSTANNTCLHQLVHLNGTQTPIITCLDNTTATSKGAAPNITTSCSQTLVMLSIPSDGDTVCLSGNGFLNLSDIFLQCTITHSWSCGTSWVGLAQNYTLYGCATNAGISGNNDYPGYFAFDYNGNGTRWNFKSIANSGAFNYPGRGINVGPYSVLIQC